MTRQDPEIRFTVGGVPVSDALIGGGEHCGFCGEVLTDTHVGDGLTCATEIEQLLEKLTDRDLPGLAVGIARHDGKWQVGQQHVGLEEVHPTDVFGSGDTLVEALTDALERMRRDARRG